MHFRIPFKALGCCASHHVEAPPSDDIDFENMDDDEIEQKLRELESGPNGDHARKVRALWAKTKASNARDTDDDDDDKPPSVSREARLSRIELDKKRVSQSDAIALDERRNARLAQIDAIAANPAVASTAAGPGTNPSTPSMMGGARGAGGAPGAVANPPVRSDDDARVAEKKSKRGRPSGAKNKQTFGILIKSTTILFVSHYCITTSRLAIGPGDQV